MEKRTDEKGYFTRKEIVRILVESVANCGVPVVIKLMVAYANILLLVIQFGLLSLMAVSLYRIYENTVRYNKKEEESVGKILDSNNLPTDVIKKNVKRLVPEFVGVFVISLILGMGNGMIKGGLNSGDSEGGQTEYSSDAESERLSENKLVDIAPETETEIRKEEPSETITLQPETEMPFVIDPSLASRASMEIKVVDGHYLSMADKEQVFFHMPKDGWNKASRVYSELSREWDDYFNLHYPDQHPQSSSQKELELYNITLASDKIRFCIESIQGIARDDFAGSSWWIQVLPGVEVIWDIIEVREQILVEYPNAELYQLLSYDYQMLGDEYVKQGCDGETTLFLYGKAILYLFEAMKYEEITSSSEKGIQIVNCIQNIYKSIQDDSKISMEYRDSAAAIWNAIEMYKESLES